MIVILYTGGNFGSTLEYCIREFSIELDKVSNGLLDDGSMHGFNKEKHLILFDEFNLLENKDIQILTPVYPTHDYLSPIETIKFWEDKVINECVIFVYGENLLQLEQTQLFAFHKLQNSFLDTVMKDKSKSWNKNYQHWRDMQKFELREALSFYIDQRHEFLNIENHVPKNWYKLTPDNILYNFEKEILKMLDFCNLTYNQKNINDFYQCWFEKQQYIIQEFELIDQIVNSIVNNQPLEWSNISILGEGIIQSRLRRNGMELACFNLNKFPNNTIDLKKYIIG